MTKTFTIKKSQQCKGNQGKEWEKVFTSSSKCLFSCRPQEWREHSWVCTKCLNKTGIIKNWENGQSSKREDGEKFGHF